MVIVNLKPWREKGKRQRGGEHKERQAAIRALILYPLNALVEDQLMRLRRACDSPEAREWLNENRDGESFFTLDVTSALLLLQDLRKKNTNVHYFVKN